MWSKRRQREKMGMVQGHAGAVSKNDYPDAKQICDADAWKMNPVYDGK